MSELKDKPEDKRIGSLKEKWDTGMELGFEKTLPIYLFPQHENYARLYIMQLLVIFSYI
jgi:hypothetical protein